MPNAPQHENASKQNQRQRIKCPIATAAGTGGGRAFFRHFGGRRGGQSAGGRVAGDSKGQYNGCSVQGDGFGYGLAPARRLGARPVIVSAAARRGTTRRV